MKNKGCYPYVVWRRMATVYQRIPVQFSQNRSNKASTTLSLITMSIPKSMQECEISTFVRQELIQIVLSMCKKFNYTMCCVFGEKDAVYCEPNGVSEVSKDIPRGGIIVT